MQVFERLALTLLLLSLTGCSTADSSAQVEKANSTEDLITAVNVAIARTGRLTEATEYIGTTKPAQEVSLRSRVEGRLLTLYVDVGDRVSPGQILGRLDDALLKSQVQEAEAELATLQSEFARAQTQLNNARISLQQAQVELQQAQSDARRYSQLAQEGAIAKQEAESFRTAAKVAKQAVLSAREEIRTEQQAVAAASGRITTQKAVIAQAQQRQAFSRLVSPLTGIVLETINDPGDLIQSGDEVLKLGDFSHIKVIVPVSELDLSEIRVEQEVEVQLDAFPNQSFSGTVSQISPVANAAARQVPVEITLPNPNLSFSSGLLARVSFQTSSPSSVIVPESALIEDKGSSATLFIVSNDDGDREAQVVQRQVSIGNRVNDQVEVVAGLVSGEHYVVDSNEPLRDGETVRLSILSER